MVLFTNVRLAPVIDTLGLHNSLFVLSGVTKYVYIHYQLREDFDFNVTLFTEFPE